MNNSKVAESLPTLSTNNDDFYLDPNASLGSKQGRLKVAASEYGVELLAYDLVREAFRDNRMTPRTEEYYERLGASPLILEFIRDGNLNFMEPAKHDRIRSVLMKAFTPRRVNEFQPAMRVIADELIDDFIDRGSCDLVGDFGHIFPISVMAQFIGVPPEDVPSFADATVQLRMLGQVPFAPGMPVLEAALEYLFGYVERLVAARRAEPSDDFVGALIALQAAGEKLSERELVWSIVFMMLAGHDTTRYTLGGCFRTFIVHDLWETLAADPLQVPAAIIESMRICPGTPRQMRLAAEPLTIAGHDLEEGSVLSLNLNTAGRDPERFAEPHRFQCPRDPAYDLGFGFGRHVCLGQPLAKAEMAVAVERLTARLTNVRLAGECRLKPGGVIAGFDTVPVSFTPRAAAA